MRCAPNNSFNPTYSPSARSQLKGGGRLHMRIHSIAIAIATLYIAFTQPDAGAADPSSEKQCSFEVRGWNDLHDTISASRVAPVWRDGLIGYRLRDVQASKHLSINGVIDGALMVSVCGTTFDDLILNGISACCDGTGDHQSIKIENSPGTQPIFVRVIRKSAT